MASALMHLYVADRFLAAGYSCSRPEQLFLGSIAPDSVNVDGFATREQRWSAHLRHADLQQWAQQAAAFYHQRPTGCDADFWLGYALHVLTDIAWDAGEHAYVWGALPRLNLPLYNEMGAGWEDCFRFDFHQAQSNWWRERIRPALLAAEARPINELPAEQIARYQQHVTGAYLQSELKIDCPPILVTRFCVERLAGQTQELARQVGVE